MNRKLTLLLPLIPLVGFGANKAAKKPLNIIYIMTDDHAFQTMSAYDKRYVETPNLDSLAAQGILFENSFVANSISGPSRACLVTGKHSHLNGMMDNSSSLDSNQLIFPRLLRQAGYKTAMIGKWHLGGKPSSDFDFWEILPGQGSYYNPDFITPTGKKHYQGYVTDIITDMGIDYLENRDKEQPFMMFLHHKALHRIWMSDTLHLTAFEDKTFDLPGNFFDDYQGRSAAAAQKMSIDKDMDLVYDLKMLDDQINSRLKSSYGEIKRMTPEQRTAWDAVYKPLTEQFIKENPQGKELAAWKFQRYMRDYLKCVQSLDENIGRLMEYLKKEGLLENTLIVYTSDQGFYMGEHGWFDKRFIYEESLRTPMVARLPNSWAGARGIKTAKMVQNIDHASTFLDLAGVKTPSEMQGMSYVPLLKGKNPKNWRHSIYYHYYEFPDEHNVNRHYGVRTDDGMKLVHFYDNGMDVWEMYDLNTDPAEMHNIYGKAEYSAKQTQLHTELTKLRKQYKVPENPKKP